MRKKFLAFILAALILFPSMSYAGSVEAFPYRFSDSSGNRITSLAIANGATIYTESIPVDDNMGYLSILVKEDKSGGAGTVAITAEYSFDGTNFYSYYTTSAGVLTVEPAVVSALANQTRLIQHTARMAKFLRYKIVAGAASQLTFDVMWQRTH